MSLRLIKKCARRPSSLKKDIESVFTNYPSPTTPSYEAPPLPAGKQGLPITDHPTTNSL